MTLGDWRYPMPTICDEIPRAVPAPRQGEAAHRVHEDDWRQVELVSEEYEPAVVEEIAAIQAVVDEVDDGPGFKTVHVRSRLSSPLHPAKLTRSSLSVALPGRVEPLGYLGQRDVIVGGFATTTADGLVVYGQADDSDVLIVGLELPRSGMSDRDCEALAGLLQTERLLLAHWCRRVYTPGPAGALRNVTT
jgi:hypothetical protein